MNVGSIINGGFRLIREKPIEVAAWAFLYLLANVAMSLATRGLMADRLAAVQIGAVSTITALEQTALVFFLYLILFLILFAACQRAVLEPDRRGFFYLRVGMDELRLLGLALLFIVLYLVASLVLALISSAVVGVIIIAIGVRAVLFLAYLPLVILLLLGLWTETRFALAFPLTMMRRKFVIGESWRITRGRFWRLFGAFFVLLLLITALWVLLALATNASYFASLLNSGLDPLAARRADQAQLAAQLGPISGMMVWQWVIGAIVGTIAIVVFAGAVATAAKELTVNLREIAETFA